MKPELNGTNSLQLLFLNENTFLFTNSFHFIKANSNAKKNAKIILLSIGLACVLSITSSSNVCAKVPVVAKSRQDCQ